jgi:hypothetical protein
MLQQGKPRRSDVSAGIFAAMIAIAVIIVPGRPSLAKLNAHIGILGTHNTSVNVAQADSTSTCSADISGTWSGSLAFQIVGPNGNLQAANVRSLRGSGVGATTVHNGFFVWEMPGAKACRIAMTSYRGGNAVVDLASSSATAIPVASPADPPSYVTWYYPTPTPWPTPITGAYVGIGGALGAGNVYNTATNGFGVSGTGMLATGACFFLCYGAPGVASANVLAMGNDVNVLTKSFTTLGAPDDCTTSTPPLCPAGVGDQVFAIDYYASAHSTPAVFLAIDPHANFAISNNIYAGAAVVAGAGLGNPVPSPNPGSLVSFTGAGLGEILLGSAGPGNHVKCDFGETNLNVLTCNQPLVVSNGSTSAGLNGSGVVWAMGGVQPHSTSAGGSGGYAPEAFPLGVATAHPQILTGTCSVTTPSTMCSFLGGRAFADTTYNCTISAQGTTGIAASYNKTSSSAITIYTSASASFSYTCI